MKEFNLDDLAKQMADRSDFPITEKQAKSFIKGALGKTLAIIKNSKGKILVKNCDVQQFYKDIPLEEMKAQVMDLNETQNLYNRIRIY